MPQANVNGIVLRCHDLGEKDRIIVLLTAELGKIRVVAKGAKRPGGRFAAAATPLVELSASISVGRNLHTLTQAEIVSSHGPLREQLERLAYGLFMTELVDHSTVDSGGQKESLTLLTSALQQLEGRVSAELTHCFFLVKLLELSGLSPAQEYCASCQATDKPLVALSAVAGGMVCEQCAAGMTGVYPLPPVSVELLQNLSGLSWGDYAMQDYSSRAAMPLCRALEQFLFYHLDVRPRSYDFLVSVRNQ